MSTDAPREPDASPSLPTTEGPPVPATEDWSETTGTLTEHIPKAVWSRSETEGEREAEPARPAAEDWDPNIVTPPVTQVGFKAKSASPVTEGGRGSWPAQLMTEARRVPPPAIPISQGGLMEDEVFWRDHYPWLEFQGYELRPRYRPDWVPSWAGTNAEFWDIEDGLASAFGQIIDATRSSDGQVVIFKIVDTAYHPYEVEITRMFSLEPLASNPRNHCVPLYDVLGVPDDDCNDVLLVLPLLRKYNDPPIQTVGEAVDFFHQIFEGLQFIHENHVAHRDCMNLNIMMDPSPLFPNLYHPSKPNRSWDLKRRARCYTRTARPTKYYFIDFGISRRYNPEDGSPREDPIWGGDKTVPEFHRSNDPCDPFPTDIYYLGNLIREDFLLTYHGVEFMQSLVSDMVQNDPNKRPTINQVVAQFADLRGKLGYWKLRSRLVPREEFWIMKVYRTIRHILRTVEYIATNRPPVPTMIPQNMPDESTSFFQRFIAAFG